MTATTGVPALPEGLTARPLTTDDAPGVFEVVADQERDDLGQVDISLEDDLSDWQRPSYDIATSTVGVFDGDRLVAYGDVAGPEHAYAAVHPDHQGRGIGTAIAAWLQATARSRGSARIGSQVPAGSAADRLMADLGYRVRWTAWDLALPEEVEITPSPLPEGFVLRDATPDDHEPAWTLVEDAFLEWSDRPRHPLDDFASWVWGRPGFEPWNLRLLENAEGELVGATHVYLSGDSAYVARIAVRRDHRGRRLARAMLVDAFGLARQHGAARSYLSTDTRAGARAVYEAVGMVVASTWVNRSVDL
ncbi:MAG: GNAT family N-acetyltransferase [Nocardioides sp.]